MQICHYKIKVIDQTLTLEFIAQSIVGAPDFWGTTLRMAMVTDSVLHTRVCYYGLNVKLNCYEMTLCESTLDSI